MQQLLKSGVIIVIIKDVVCLLLLLTRTLPGVIRSVYLMSRMCMCITWRRLYSAIERRGSVTICSIFYSTKYFLNFQEQNYANNAIKPRF